MRAFAAQIIPSGDGTPGAEEAGAVHFIDRALGMPFFADTCRSFTPVSQISMRARGASASAAGFAALSARSRVDVCTQIEHDPFFAIARSSSSSERSPIRRMAETAAALGGC